MAKFSKIWWSEQFLEALEQFTDPARLGRGRSYALGGRVRDLSTNGSCPDWANPCKHIAGVYYLVAAELDRDPDQEIGRLSGVQGKRNFLAGRIR